MLCLVLRDGVEFTDLQELLPPFCGGLLDTTFLDCVGQAEFGAAVLSIGGLPSAS